MMPKMNGLEVASALKADPVTAGIPVILLSAKAQESDIKAGQSTGAEDYMTKPFDPLDLLDRVAALLARQRS
jgi:DNA-binding response OmpR family regulator